MVALAITAVYAALESALTYTAAAITAGSVLAVGAEAIDTYQQQHADSSAKDEAKAVPITATEQETTKRCDECNRAVDQAWDVIDRVKPPAANRGLRERICHLKHGPNSPDGKVRPDAEEADLFDRYMRAKANASGLGLVISLFEVWKQAEYIGHQIALSDTRSELLRKIEIASNECAKCYSRRAHELKDMMEWAYLSEGIANDNISVGKHYRPDFRFFCSQRPPLRIPPGASL